MEFPEEQFGRLLDVYVGILKSLETLNERVAEVAKRFAPMAPSEPPPAKPRRWRYREANEIVQPGDWANSVKNPVGDWPPAAGWMDARSCVGECVGKISDQLRVACEVTDEAEQPPPQPLEPEYREPVLPRDAGKQCQFSDDGERWVAAKPFGWRGLAESQWKCSSGFWWRFARIRKDA